MIIDRETVEKVARLAHIQLSEDDIGYYQRELGSILDYMQQIQTAGEELPADWRADTAGVSCPERDDEAKHSHVIERVLQSAPKVVGTAFQVPRIIE
ncbi:MAG: aspartyl/glutamyl-tRNA amidotransferase subunit C [Chitinophagaceae bacterium]|nr:aspartyl/glutamyl-tRNA amidotransferase subunit C [Oligoflexus sp.]